MMQMMQVRWIACAFLVGACSCSDDGFSSNEGEAEAEAESEAESEGGPGYDYGSTPDATGYDAPSCAAKSVAAESVTLPIDIIFIVDSSGSMDFENEQVQDNLNDFSSIISASGVDHHVVLIGDSGYICVEPPLCPDGCPGCFEGPNFLHYDQDVDSNNSLELILSTYSGWQDFLREGALKHFVEVTDDESDLSASSFISMLGALTDPGFPVTTSQPYGFTFHSIVAYGSVPFIGCVTGAAVGNEYMDLTDMTGGVLASICDTDWTPIFDELAEAVVVGTELPCVYEIPPPPAGMTLDPNQVNVVFTPPGGDPETIPRVDGPTDCTAAGGWYYDDPDDPTQVVVCPATCDDFEAASGGTVDIAFGCDTIIG